MRLLSTKLLTVNFKDRLVQKGFSLVEFPFIKIKPLNTEIKTLEDNIIITSQNAASLVLNNPHLSPKLEGKNYFCVGEKTKMLLTGNGLKVIKMSQNASILSNFITKNHKNASFSFLCGIQRRPEIETELAKNKIPLSVHKIYDTLYTNLKGSSIPEAVLVLAKYQYQIAFVADQEINLLACLTEIMLGCEFK